MPTLPNPHTTESSEVLSTLSTSLEGGLSEQEVSKRILTYGKNTIEEKEKESLLRLLLSQFTNSMTLLLVVAAGLSFLFNEWLDGIAIVVVIFVNSIIGFLMEFQAGRSMDALKKMVRVSAKVIRDSTLKEVSSEMLVPGDILFVEAGDMIAADARLLICSQFQVDESALTGESVPVEKQSTVLLGEKALAERTNMIFKGTFVSKGNAKAVIVSTGMNSEFGKIATMIQHAEQEATPLEKKLAQFSKKLIGITVGLVVLIFAVGVLNGHGFLEMLETSIALAVAAIPEGLPIVATLALAQGMLKMASHNVIVRKLAAVETLGGTSVICTDKTGTLTENKIEVGLLVLSDQSVEVKKDNSGRVRLVSPLPLDPENSESFQLVKRIAALCNTSDVLIESGVTHEIGDPLETGLQKFASAFHTDIAQLKAEYPKTDEIPFSSEAKIMVTLHKKSDSHFVAAKGATEELLDRCLTVRLANDTVELTAVSKKWWLDKAEEISSQGLRTLTLAYKHSEQIPAEMGSGLTLLALVGLLDPPRQEVAEAITECKAAGIKVVMVTGDHPATARNIAFKLGITQDKHEPVIIGKNMPEAEHLDDTTRKQWLATRIFARVSPKQKLDLVTVFQNDRQVVGMTGDGINDAPALKKADIGIAMGLRGTQVAQQVADMVLKDDSFASIVSAIRQGRAIFENIRKFVIYLLSCNLSELFIVAITSILNFHFQMFPLQILFINIVTDVLPALALGVTEANSTIMARPPRNESERIVGKREWISVFVYSGVITLACLAAVLTSHYTIHVKEPLTKGVCNNVLFYTLIFSQLWHVMNMAIEKKGWFFHTEVTKNKYVWLAIVCCLGIVAITYTIPAVRTALSVEPMTTYDWGMSLVFSLCSLIVIQLLKRTNIIH